LKHTTELLNKDQDILHAARKPAEYDVTDFRSINDRLDNILINGRDTFDVVK